MASVPVGGPFLNFLPVISKEVKCFEKGMHTEIRFEGRVQVFFCPSSLLFALEVEGEEVLNLLVFWGNKELIIHVLFILYFCI